MAEWRVAAVQMDPQLGATAANIATMRRHLRTAAEAGARLVVFPECAITGYGMADRNAALALAEPVPGPSVVAISETCAELGVYCVFGLLERVTTADGQRLYNSCVLVGPQGFIADYRKIHLPCVGADKFTDPGDRPFAVQDLGGLRISMSICFDGGFPETARVQTLLGADLIVLPTNWSEKAMKSATLVPPVRAFENHVYHLAVNRIGDESGFHYIGRSSIIDPTGDLLAFADHDREEIIYADIDPEKARSKRIVHCAGEYEIDRLAWRRPEFYGPIAAETERPFKGHRPQ